MPYSLSGRVRVKTDRGVLMICDPRLVEKHYGRRIWQSLPPMLRTRDVVDVEAFFNASAASSETVALA